MGKRGLRKGAPNLTIRPQASISLREESCGKILSKANAKSILKLEHTQNLAVWAAGEASIPSLGAFFGQRLAACSESIGVPTDPSVFTCQRCESVLQPGNNCTVRIEKNRSKRKHKSKKPITPTQNNLVYNCHFCLHRNLMRGTPKGHLKEVFPTKVKPPRKFSSAESTVQNPNKIDNVALQDKIDEVVLQEVVSNAAGIVIKTGGSLLEGKRRKRNRSGACKPVESEIGSANATAASSSKRRRKSWTSLKEIAESSSSQKFSNLSIPFLV